MRSGIIAGGNWIVDHVKVIDAWPPQDALATIVSESWGNGGSPYNVLKNLAKLGATFPREAIGRVGDDASGRRIREDCAAHRIDTSQLRVTPEAPTSYTDVMTDRTTRRRTFFHQRGANALLAPEDFDFSQTRARRFHLGYLLLLDALDAAGAGGLPRSLDVLRRARAAGLATSVDCVSENSDRFKTVAAVLPEVDVLFANDFEAEKLTGMAVGRGAQLDRAAMAEAGRQLVALGVREWAVIHCPEGACACSRRGDVLWQGRVLLPERAVAGTAGAGDAFAAGVLLGLHESASMAECLHLGVSVAAASLRHVNCSDGVGSMGECRKLAALHGVGAL